MIHSYDIQLLLVGDELSLFNKNISDLKKRKANAKTIFLYLKHLKKFDEVFLFYCTTAPPVMLYQSC